MSIWYHALGFASVFYDAVFRDADMNFFTYHQMFCQGDPSQDIRDVTRTIGIEYKQEEKTSCLSPILVVFERRIIRFPQTSGITGDAENLTYSAEEVQLVSHILRKRCFRFEVKP